MIMPSLKEMIRAIFATCPDCRQDKLVCLVACERVSRRLDEIDTKLKEEGL